METTFSPTSLGSGSIFSGESIWEQDSVWARRRFGGEIEGHTVKRVGDVLMYFVGNKPIAYKADYGDAWINIDKDKQGRFQQFGANYEALKGMEKEHGMAFVDEIANLEKRNVERRVADHEQEIDELKAQIRRLQPLSDGTVEIDQTPDGTVYGSYSMPEKKKIFSGNVYVAGNLFTSFTGTESDYLKVYFDGTTPPAYGVESDLTSMSDDYEVFELSKTYGDIHVMRD